MAQFYFGLNVNRNLTDISNRNEALRNVNLDIKDLDKIRGISAAPVQRTDFQTLSGIDFDFYKLAKSLYSDTTVYNSLLTSVYDESSFIQSNLDISGQLAATSIKYQFVDFAMSSAVAADHIKFADISTSRISSWSSFAAPQLESSPIVYGGEVRVGGAIELSKLNINQTPSRKRFAAEIPTHKIKMTIGGIDYYLYAMKGIPLTFQGYFKNAPDAIGVNISQVRPANPIAPTWVIKDVDTGLELVYRDVLNGNNSTIGYSNPTAKLRDIQLYYPVDNILDLGLRSLNIVELPQVVLQNLRSIDLYNNDFREFPDLSRYSSLTTLNISSNNLMRGVSLESRSLSPQVVAKIPTSITSLTVGNCYDGLVTGNFSQLPLVALNINSGGRRLSGPSPAVNSSTIETYSITGNYFSSVDQSVRVAANLKALDISDNSISDNDLTISSTLLESFVSISGNTHNIVDVSNKRNLSYYVHQQKGNTQGNNIVTNTFTGCSALSYLSLYYSWPEGDMPKFIQCTSLRIIQMHGTAVNGILDAQSGITYALNNDTFNSCRKTLVEFYLYSTRMNGNVVETDALKDMDVMTVFWFSDSFIVGSMPSFATAKRLVYVYMHNNRLGGPGSQIPSFSSNAELQYLNLTNNSFEGSVPDIPGTNFRILYLGSNNLKGFNKFILATGLIILHVQSNLLTLIPDLSNLPILAQFNFESQRAGPVSYTNGSFSGLISANYINLLNCSINQGDVHAIILDLLVSFKANPNRGMDLNLLGNAAPSTSAKQIQDALSTMRAGGWQIQTQ